MKYADVIDDGCDVIDDGYKLFNCEVLIVILCLNSGLLTVMTVV